MHKESLKDRTMALTFTKIENGERVAELRDLSIDEAAAAVYEAMHGTPYQTPVAADTHAEQPLAA
jgi:hypothetical protein